MTSRDLIVAALRRWYVMLVGAVLSLGCVYVATHQQPVYWTQFNVLLIGPQDPDFPNYLEDPRFTLYPLVGVVVDDVNHGRRGMLTASTDTNMVGQGMTDGVQVRVPNLGTQWRRDMSASHIDVQVAASTPEEVTRRADDTVDEIAASLAERQDAMRIVPGMRVTARPATKAPPIYQIGGNQMRAAGASGMSGAALTIALVCWLERRRNRRLASAEGAGRVVPAVPVPDSSARELVDA
jgi:hypothetical protein